MKVAVTAASGRLGHAILRHLTGAVGAGNVIGVARDPARLRVAGVGTRAGDYQSIASMAAALRGIDTAIVISAPVVGASDRVTLHRNVLAGAKQAGVDWVIAVSLIGNGAEAATWFGPTQAVNRQGEADLKASGLAFTIARNGLYLDLDLRHILKAGADGGLYANPGGEGRTGYISIDEIACAYARIVTDSCHQGQTYNIAGEPVSQADLVATANRVFAMNVRYGMMADEDCVAHFARIMPERGPAVARMLTGAFQCIRAGAFDVPSDYATAAGRPVKSLDAMMTELRTSLAGA